MTTNGVRELTSRASEIVRLSREEQPEYVAVLRASEVATSALVQPDRAGLRDRALDLAGRFHFAIGDLSDAHDSYLVEAFEA